jgi:hypothetical protein
MPLDPTILDLDNLNPIIRPIASTSKNKKLLLFSLIITTALIAAGLYLYNNNLNDAQTK